MNGSVFADSTVSNGSILPYAIITKPGNVFNGEAAVDFPTLGTTGITAFTGYVNSILGSALLLYVFLAVRSLMEALRG